MVGWGRGGEIMRIVVGCHPIERPGEIETHPISAADGGSWEGRKRESEAEGRKKGVLREENRRKKVKSERWIFTLPSTGYSIGPSNLAPSSSKP
jgi:hypothetical protein